MMKDKELTKHLKNVVKFWDEGWQHREWSQWQIKLLLFFRSLKVDDVSDLRLMLGERWFRLVNGLFEFNYKEYLKTIYWQNLSKKIKEKTKKCQICSSPERLEVHHNNYKNLFVETEADLTVLCRKCHSKFHDKEVE